MYMDKKITVSICIPAFNEEKNIGRLLHALLLQHTHTITIQKIVVVSSGSTDRTPRIAQWFVARHPKISLIHENARLGKANAINSFLKDANEEIVIIESADTLPLPSTIERLCSPFHKDKKIGMTGGAPIPVNDPNTFLGYIIHAWWWFHRNIPRFGELVAFRNILPEISNTTAVDEAYIQARLIKEGYKAVHVDEAVVRNKGAETVRDIIKQRRRIFNGHARLYEEEHVKIDNMTKSSLYLLLFKFQIHSLKELLWLLGGIGLELYTRILGAYDTYVTKDNPVVWDVASSTKSLHLGEEAYI
jgi:cellulose synthase/poly-beta-1,6-N-acetylglucosamine synthase-like glycosyltransferase